jgi:3-hydroxyisobutyrate dehydrogenase-like beta-hydroxyacid dehydrogenase
MNVMKDDKVHAASPIRKIAVIGIGSMGNPMSRRIRGAGFNLTVCDKNKAVLEDFAAMGARTTVTPADCADSDVVIVLVATREQLRAVCLGEDGLKRATSAGQPRHIVVMSTVAPQDMRELETAFARTPTHIVDAPISGGVVRAQKGTLTILAGGAEADVAALRPVFEALGDKVFHCGALGSGQVTKIVNNIIAISNLMFSAEAYRLAVANGLTLERIMPALESGSARNFMSANPRDAPETYAAASRTDESYRALQTINGKDIDLALSLNDDHLQLPAVTALRELLRKTGQETLANWRVIGGVTPT